MSSSAVSCCTYSPRLRSHPPLRLPRQSAAGYSLTPLLSITRPHTTTADRISSNSRRASQPFLSLSQMRRDNGHHPDPHRRSDPAPFSAFVPPCRMKPISKNRKSRSVFRLDPPSCALPPKRVLVPDPESVPIAVIFYFSHCRQAIVLFSHQTHRSIASLMPPIEPN